MAAAIVKFNALSNPIGTTSQNNDLLLRGGLRFIFRLIGRIQVRRETLEFRSAGIHMFVDWRNAIFLAQMPDLFRRDPLVSHSPHLAQTGIRDTHALGLA